MFIQKELLKFGVVSWLCEIWVILQLIAAENLIISDQDKCCAWVVLMFYSAVNTSHISKRQSCCEVHNPVKKLKYFSVTPSLLFLIYHLVSFKVGYGKWNIMQNLPFKIKLLIFFLLKKGWYRVFPLHRHSHKRICIFLSSSIL